MTWYDTKQAAVDPDNPAANEQIPFSEWNAMVTYLKDKIIDKAVNAAAIGNDKVLVYKTATSTFVFEAQSAVGAIDDLTDVTISGVPADNEVLAYDTGTSEWINQTAAEAGLATVAGLAAYYPLSGATLTGNLNMGDYLIDDVDDIRAYDASGILFRDNAGNVCVRMGSSGQSFMAYYECDMNTHKILNVVDPTTAQGASTKNYDDTHLFTKEIVTSFTDGFVPVYRTSSGKFEMEAGGGSAGLPVADTTSIVKGSADGTKQMRMEVDGLTAGATRVMTIPDKDMTLCGTDDAMLLNGANPMAADLDMGGYNITGADVVEAQLSNGKLELSGGIDLVDPIIDLYGKDNPGGQKGNIVFRVPNVAEDASLTVATCMGLSDAPLFKIGYGLDMNAADINDIGALILNDATELTIATGVVTATQSYHSIDTEGDIASDDLDTISGGTAGMALTIRAINTTHTVVVKHATGNILLDAAADKTLDNVNDTLSLLYNGSNWLQTGFSNNGA